MQVQQTMLATLSLGPVGISDQLSGRPEDPTAKITSNKTLVMATCAADGMLLQPSFPLVPIERMITGAGEFGDCFGPTHRAYTYGCGAHTWATYSAIPVGGKATGVHDSSRSSSNVGLWWTALGFFSGRGGSPVTTITLREDDLAPMVDAQTLPTADFSDIPAAYFNDAGLTFPAPPSLSGSSASVDTTAATSSPQYVAWEHRFVHQVDCSGVVVHPWNGSTALSIVSPKGHSASEDYTTQLNIAPVFNGLALLGEAGKVTSVSTYRFSSVAAASQGEGSRQGLTVAMRGKPGEAVGLLFASTSSVGVASELSSYTCSLVKAVIGADGTGTATFPASAASY